MAAVELAQPPLWIGMGRRARSGQKRAVFCLFNVVFFWPARATYGPHQNMSKGGSK